MKRKRYDRMEIGVGALGLGAAALWAVTGSAGVDVGSVPLAEVFRWSGVVLLLQGFARDVAILVRRRLGRGAPGAEGPPKRGWWICLESTLGLVLLGQALLLGALGAGEAAPIALPWAGWLALLAAWWLFGYATREVVMEVRRDPDHLNLLVGRRSPARVPAATE